MTSGLKGALYTTLIAGTVLAGGYIADKKLHLGVKENIAGRLIENPRDAAMIYINELGKSKDNSKYGKEIYGLMVSSSKYLDDKTRILTADELIRMTAPKMQESYLELKLRQLPEDKKLKIAEKTLKTLSMDKVLYLIDTQSDSTQNAIVKHVVGTRISGFFEDAREGIKRAYEETIGRLDDK